ncbi:hypothetical protein DFJ74DRAFT_666743 [Hyaloraphidium curvatum]|nr:hypothetical protein DFJ74DRAFT_666743 [Hyaloraphidium curvatum]
MAVPRFQLCYYEAPGREELARMLFALAGEPFTFVPISDDVNWGVRDPEKDVKRTTPFGRVPILVETRTEGPKKGEKFILAESRSIERYIAREFGLDGKDRYEQAEVDMLVTNIRGFFDQVGNYIFEAPVAFRRMLQMNFRNKKWPDFLRDHEALLKKNGDNGHYVGDTTTYADLATYYFLVALKNLDGELLAEVTEEQYPAICKLVKVVGQEPRIRGYMVGLKRDGT